LKVPVLYLDIKSDRFKNIKIGEVNVNVGQLKFGDFEPSGQIVQLKSGSKLPDMALFKRFRKLILIGTADLYGKNYKNQRFSITT
jgi:hypothetical protein